MADEEVLTDEPVEEQPAEDESQDIDTKIADAVAKVQEQFKKELAGLNRRNTDLEKELAEEKKAHMSDKERLEYEQQQKEEALAEREKKLADAERKNLITSGLAEKNLNLSVQGLMKMPNDADELSAWLETFETAVNAEVEKRVNNTLSSGGAPKSGSAKPSTKPLESYEDAQNATDEEFRAYLQEAIGE